MVLNRESQQMTRSSNFLLSLRDFLGPSCSLPFITLCSLKRDDIPTSMRPGSADLIEYDAFLWLQCLDLIRGSFDNVLAHTVKPEPHSESTVTIGKYRLHYFCT